MSEKSHDETKSSDQIKSKKETETKPTTKKEKRPIQPKENKKWKVKTNDDEVWAKTSDFTWVDSSKLEEEHELVAGAIYLWLQKRDNITKARQLYLKTNGKNIPKIVGIPTKTKGFMIPLEVIQPWLETIKTSKT